MPGGVGAGERAPELIARKRVGKCARIPAAAAGAKHIRMFVVEFRSRLWYNAAGKGNQKPESAHRLPRPLDGGRAPGAAVAENRRRVRNPRGGSIRCPAVLRKAIPILLILTCPVWANGAVRNETFKLSGFGGYCGHSGRVRRFDDGGYPLSGYLRHRHRRRHLAGRQSRELRRTSVGSTFSRTTSGTTTPSPARRSGPRIFRLCRYSCP